MEGYALKIALASARVADRETAQNLREMLACMARLRGKADLVVFGETALQGFGCLCWAYDTDKHTAVTLEDDSILQLRRAAKENGIAVSFGFIERAGDVLYSSQLFLGADGEVVKVFRRVSAGWKEVRQTDAHYREGRGFEKFVYGGQSFAIALCGDLWTDGRPEEMKVLGAEIVLWPVWCDFPPEEWNAAEKYEYAKQAERCGTDVLYVNPYCVSAAEDCATGGAAHFRAGRIERELPAGAPGCLMVELSRE